MDYMPKTRRKARKKENPTKDLFFNSLDNTKISVRKAEKNDYLNVKKAFEQYDAKIYFDLEKIDFTKVLFNGLIAEYDDYFAGFLTFEVGYAEKDLKNIFIVVDEKYRDIGVGKKLVKKLIAMAMENNLEFLTCKIHKSNKPSIKLFQSLKFKRIENDEIGFNHYQLNL